MESVSVLKAVIGEKTYRAFNNDGKDTARSAVSEKDTREQGTEPNDSFEMKFHLRRSDLERWISAVLKDEELKTEEEEIQGTVLSIVGFRAESHPRVLEQAKHLHAERMLKQTPKLIKPAGEMPSSPNMA